MDDMKKMLQTIIKGQVSLQTQLLTEIDKLDKRLRGTEERLAKRIDEVEDILSRRIDNVEDKLSRRIDSVEDKLTVKIESVEEQLINTDAKLTKRIDRLGNQLAYLDEDAPTREEFDNLEKRVSVVEDKAIKRR